MGDTLTLQEATHWRFRHSHAGLNGQYSHYFGHTCSKSLFEKCSEPPTITVLDGLILPLAFALDKEAVATTSEQYRDFVRLWYVKNSLVSYICDLQISPQGFGRLHEDCSWPLMPFRV